MCVAGWRDTYQGIDTPDRIEAVIAEYYSPDRIAGEIDPRPGWDGWIVAVEDDSVVGAGAGGATGPGVAEIFVLYLDPSRRGEGIGTLPLGDHRAAPRAGRARAVGERRARERERPAVYRARGFEERGTRPAWGVDPGEGRVSLRLARRLGVTSPA